jgi:hypothetical protein
MELTQDAVPKPDPGLDAVARGTPSPLAFLRNPGDEIVEQLTPFGAVTVAVEFDMPIHVINKVS